MRSLMKYSLAVQVAVAGVALAQMPAQTDRPVQSDTGVTAGVRTDDLRSDRSMPAGAVRASHLIGTKVYNQQDKHLGKIHDIVLDKDCKKVGYVVLSYGGLAGLGDKLFALPRNMVQLSPTGENRALVSLDDQVLKNAPGFDEKKWPTEANADYYRKLEKYYHETAGNRLSQAQSPSLDIGGAQPAGVRMGSDDMLTWTRRASSLIGASVKDAQNEKLGEINDLVMDWPGGKIRYAVLSYGGILGIGDKLFAVPIDSFQARDTDLVLGIDKEQIKSAPGFDKSQWPDIADPQWSKSIDEFYGRSRGN